MDPHQSALLVEGKGLDGSVGRSSRRQVTLIEREVWDALMRETGCEPPCIPTGVAEHSRWF